MLLSQHLIQQFGNLPYLSKTEIIKHLDQYELLKMAIICNGWIEVVEPFLKKKEDRKDIAITLGTTESAAEITVSKNPWMEKTVRLSIDLVMDSTDRVVLKSPESLTIHSQSVRTHQHTVLSTIRLFRSLFQVIFFRIHLNVDFGYSLKFLESLEPERFERVVWLDLEAENVRVNGEKLEKILRKFNVQARRKLNIKTMRNFKGADYLMERGLELDDSKWITGRMLVEKYDSPVGIFRKCRFSERDYNLFFQKFKDGQKGDLGFLEFHSEKPLNLATILRDLDAKPWDPEFRSRKKDLYCISFQIFDLADGWDIVCSKRKTLGTVHLSENRKILQFHYWQFNENFPLPELLKTLISYKELCKSSSSAADLKAKERKYYDKEIEDLDRKIRILTEALEDNS